MADAPQGELEDGSEVAIKVRALPLAVAEEYVCKTACKRDRLQRLIIGSNMFKHFHASSLHTFCTKSPSLVSNQELFD